MEKYTKKERKRSAKTSSMHIEVSHEIMVNNETKERRNITAVTWRNVTEHETRIVEYPARIVNITHAHFTVARMVNNENSYPASKLNSSIESAQARNIAAW